MRKVEVQTYDQQWKVKFTEEANLLHHIFGSEIIEIFHIGSTSVIGLKSKPIIDIMPVVRNINRIEAFNPAMAAVGYEARGENGIIGRRYFQKGGNDRTHHIHIYEYGHPDIERHVAFRDYLRNHPLEAKQYGELKEKLAARFPFDITSYINGKEPLVLEIERKAIEWYRQSNSSV